MRPYLRIAAAVLFAGYVGWNALWLAQGTFAPSVLTAATGIPCPTTGGTRALFALIDGDWRASLSWNAMAVPILLLFVVSAFWALAEALARGRPRLPGTFLWLWIGSLGLAWVLKLAV